MEKVKKREDNLEEGIANVTEELKKGNHEDTFGELEKIVERLIEQKTRVATGYDNWQNRGIFITPDSVNLAPDNFYFEIDKHHHTWIPKKKLLFIGEIVFERK